MLPPMEVDYSDKIGQWFLAIDGEVVLSFDSEIESFEFIEEEIWLYIEKNFGIQAVTNVEFHPCFCVMSLLEMKTTEVNWESLLK